MCISFPWNLKENYFIRVLWGTTSFGQSSTFWGPGEQIVHKIWLYMQFFNVNNQLIAYYNVGIQMQEQEVRYAHILQLYYVG